MLGDGRREASGLVAGHPPHSHEMRAHRAEGGRDVVVGDGVIEGTVEACDEGVVVVARGFAIEVDAGELRGQGGEECAIAALRGQPRSGLLQCAPDLEEPADVVGVDTRDDGDARGLLHDEPVGGETAQRLAQRCTADSEPSRLLHLGEHGAGWQHPGLDLLQQRRVGAVTSPKVVSHKGHMISVYIRFENQQKNQ